MPALITKVEGPSDTITQDVAVTGEELSPARERQKMSSFGGDSLGTT